MYSSFPAAQQMGYCWDVGEASIARDAAYRWLAAIRGGKVYGGWAHECMIIDWSITIPNFHH
jgi:hypothetical protein